MGFETSEMGSVAICTGCRRCCGLTLCTASVRSLEEMCTLEVRYGSLTLSCKADRRGSHDHRNIDADQSQKYRPALRSVSDAGGALHHRHRRGLPRTRDRTLAQCMGGGFPSRDHDHRLDAAHARRRARMHAAPHHARAREISRVQGILHAAPVRHTRARHLPCVHSVRVLMPHGGHKPRHIAAGVCTVEK